MPPKSQLPTMYDLPSEDPEDPGLPDEFHLQQPRLLSETFRPDSEVVRQYITASDLNLYYDPANPLWYKRPDWFAVLGVEPAKQVDAMRWSYVIWQEEIAPYLLVELLSPGTEKDDLGTRLRDIEQPPAKWDVYERYLQIPYYAVYSRHTGELRLFGLVAGQYRPLAETAAPRSDRKGLWLPEAGIGLGIWTGAYEGVDGDWLRFFDADGQWLPSRADQLASERKRTEQEAARAEQEATRADRLAAKLRALGVDPDTD